MSESSRAHHVHVQPDAEPEGLGTFQDVADMVKVSKRTVQTWTYRRIIPHLKIGHSVRYNMAAVRRALARFAIEEVH
jgi:excisionase family DNA binding protein